MKNLASQRSLRAAAIAALLAVPLTGVVLFACGDDDDVTGTPDARADGTTVTDAPVGSDSPTNPDVREAGPNIPDANDGGIFFCPIVNPDGLGFGTRDCNACARAWCCAAARACAEGVPDSGMPGYPDGGMTLCQQRGECNNNNCSGLTPATDAGGCWKACDDMFPAEANAKNAALTYCTYGITAQGVVDGASLASPQKSCAFHPDGGSLCQGNE
jgi:hypothetical protein